jgi:hypothetical protein
MTRQKLAMFVMTGMSSFLTVVLVANQQSRQSGTPTMGHEMSMGAMKNDTKTMTKAEKIANAIAAGPSSVSAKATILDWPVKEGMAPEVLRPGTNGWSCLPDFPESKGNDPMCLDETWVSFFQAYMDQKTPEITKVGIGYMLAPGGGWASNSDPYAMTESADNHWSHHSPHLMVAVPDTKSLVGISTDPANGGPYVMWAGTPYAHIMAPTAAGMTKK